MDFFLSILPLMGGMLALLLGSAFFSSAETAIFSLSSSDLNALMRRAPRTARRLDALMIGRQKLLVTILLGNLVINLFYFNLGAILSERAGEVLPWLAWVIPPVVLVGVILLGEIVPKMSAVRWPLEIATVAVWPLHLVEKALSIPRTILAATAQALSRVFFGDRPEEGPITTEELGLLLELAAREGSIESDEQVRLQAVLEVDRLRVRDVRTPRMDIASLHREATRDEALALHRETGCSKLILHDGDLDAANSWIDVLELMAQRGARPAEIARPLVYVPETAPVTVVLDRFRAEALRIALVIDEYGGTEGVLTREDLVGALLGDLWDERDAHEPEAILLDRHGWIVSADLPVRALGRTIGRTTPELGIRSVGGLVAARLGRLPHVGDRVESGELQFEVIAMRGRRPLRLRVSPRIPLATGTAS